jgi:hypothetical protein
VFFSIWFVAPFIVLFTLFVLCAIFIRWLAHSLDGYPAFLIQNGGRDAGIVPIALRIRSEPPRSPVLSAFVERSGVRAMNKRDVTIGHHAGPG